MSEPSEERALDAGAFSAWLTQIDAALDGGSTMDVPCGGCTACCTSSQFVHIAPDESETLARIPAELLFPAPHAPRGHVVLGYDERGHCPMLVDGACSIYEHRPRTCRTYDCRVLPAAGLAPPDDEWRQAAIAARAARWQFQHPTEDDRRAHAAVRAAASYLGEHPEVFDDGPRPAVATQVAALALEVRACFVDQGDPDPADVRIALQRRRAVGQRAPKPPRSRGLSSVERDHAGQ